MPDEFGEVFDDVPSEQRRILERMVERRLVRSFAYVDGTAKARVVYTEAGREFLRLVREVTSQEPKHRLATLVALGALSEDAIVLGGLSD
jgi:hypothetical protein